MKFSLGNKILLLLITLVVALSGIAIVVSYHVVDRMNGKHYMDKANELSATTACVINPDDTKKLRDETLAAYETAGPVVTSDDWGTPEFEAYVAHYAHLQETPEYQRLLAQFRKLQDVNTADCFYLSFVINSDERYVYLVDAATEDPCPTGCIDPLYDINRGVLTNPEIGFPAYITDTPEYGWLVSSGSPVYDQDGKVICYAFVDISMDMVKGQQQRYFMALAGGLLGLTALLSIVAILYVRHSIVHPINALSKAAQQYNTSDRDARSTFEELNIHTKDEIESLCNSMIKMEHDIDTYIDNLVETREKLKDTRIEADMMNDLAHRDALTGIRNKLAYDQEILRLEAERQEGAEDFGIAIIDLNDLKVTNDRYGHDKGDLSLQSLSDIICSVFVHSPVFRIGGDEFAVILRNNDYDKIEELYAEFRSRIDALRQASPDAAMPWERVSAAIGYALYDPELDDGPTGVFRRADEHMYENKRQMKNGEAPR